MVEIVGISAREILDSRANPSIEAEVRLSDGSVGVASVPSGASTGKNEAKELRDTDSPRYHRKGVLAAVENVNEIIFPALVGISPFDGAEADSVMIALDGTGNKSKLGANAILSVSVAIARAAAASLGIPLYRYLGGSYISKMPIPLMNVLNGGAHAANNIDIQEFMLAPIGAESFADAVRMCSEVYITLKNVLGAKGYATAVGDEGGFAPMLSSDEEAIELLLLAIEKSGYSAERDIKIALDAAASEWYANGSYFLGKRGISFTSDALVDYFADLARKYPIISIEDPMGEDDEYGWEKISSRTLSGGMRLVGDDLFVTDAERIRLGAKKKIANTALIKPNQIGSVSETVEAIDAARSVGYGVIVSHRSGETEDTFIADLAVAKAADFVKMGAPARGERTAKYNRLMKIESELFAPSYGI